MDNPALTPTRTPSLIGASTWEQDLFSRIHAHVEKERELIALYQDLAKSTSSQAIRFLAGLILAEEEQHHRLYADLAKSLQVSAEMSREAPPVPRLAPYAMPEAERKAMLDLTERFLKLEEMDLRELDGLARELDPVKRTTLWHLLARMMRMDNEKHIEMLRFIRDQMRHT